MLGMFLSRPSQVPYVVAEFVAEQVGGVEAAALKQYPERLPTQHEHAREVRDRLGLREFDDAELELRALLRAGSGCRTRGRGRCSTGRWSG
jgi:hypothetical protein